MTRLRHVFVLLFTLLLTASVHPAMAQEGETFPEFADLQGLQAAVSRGYQLDFSALEAGDQDYRDALFFAGIVMEFDDGANAATGYETFVDHGVDGLLAGWGMEDPAPVETDLDNLGDQAQAFSVLSTGELTEGFVRYVVMQQDRYVFVTVILTEAEESTLDADALTAYFSDAVAGGHSGLGTFVAEGGSTGGLWDFYPAAEHELYEGLAPDGDEIFYPVP